MAQIQTSDGVASVAPRTDVGDDYEHIQASPEDFGAAQAQANAALSGGLSKLGQGAEQAGKFWGQVQVDGVQNAANESALGVVKQFTNLNGTDALKAQDDALANVGKAYSDARSKLSTPDQIEQFDQQTRSYRQRFLDPQIYSHAKQQGFEYAKTTNENTTKQGFDALAANADDPEKADAAMDMVITGAVKNAHLHLGESATEEDTRNFVRPYLQQALKTQAQSLAVNNPAKAADFVEQNKDNIGADYALLSNQFRTRATEQTALGIVDASSRDTSAAIAGQPQKNNVAAVTQAMLDQESGNKSNVGTSVNGAVGPGQILPATFAQYAKPGEDINNPVDNRAVTGRMVQDYATKYDGDPGRIAVAYFSGPGNVAPVGAPQPYLVDKTDGNGKSVSSYVSDITNRVSTQSGMLAAKATMYDKVLAATDSMPPEVRDRAIKEVKERYAMAETASLQDQAARKAQTETTLRQAGDIIDSGQPVNIRQQYPNLSEEQVEHLQTLQKTRAQEALNGAPGDWGPASASVQNRIYSTGPDRIINQEQLLPLASSGAINPTGYKALSQTLADVNKPGAEADRILQSNFYKSAERAVTLESELIPGAKRAGADEKWRSALPVLNQAISAARAQGVPNSEIMDPNNKNSVWSALQPFLPPPAEAKAAQMRDAIAADRQAATPSIDWQKITNKDEAMAAYNNKDSKGKPAPLITREQARTLFERNNWGPSSNAAPQVPTGGQ